MGKKLKLDIVVNNKSYPTIAEEGTNLLKHLQDNNFEIFAPCGGLGSCGKCKVYITGKGDVLSCTTFVNEDMEIILPNQREIQVLEAQHTYKAYFSLNPGDAVNRSSFPLGVAIDIGTTTIVFYLINLITGQTEATQSLLNPQTKYGGDVISRISYCNENENGADVMQKQLVDTINIQLDRFAQNTGYDKSLIVKIVITGNTTMLHFLAKVDTSTIGLAPYKPVFIDQKKIKANKFGIEIAPDSDVILMPSISAFVGSDIVSGVASLNMPEAIKNYLFVDIGTNGEMALVTPDKIICCATAAGPAFEGANISCGMPAQDGAIDSYTQNGFTTINKGKAVGICGSGLIDVIATLLSTELIDAEGVMEEDFVLVDKSESGNKQNVVLSRNDIREVQLAKSAITAGMLTLVNQARLELKDIDALVLAGGFGNYIRPESAVRIGLFPKELKDKIIPVGNAAGTGAQIYLQSISFEEHVEAIRKRSSYIELFDIEEFVLEYAMQMYFPID